MTQFPHWSLGGGRYVEVGYTPRLCPLPAARVVKTSTKGIASCVVRPLFSDAHVCLASEYLLLRLGRDTGTPGAIGGQERKIVGYREIHQTVGVADESPKCLLR